jgi:PPIC-type PPIASE domain
MTRFHPGIRLVALGFLIAALGCDRGASDAGEDAADAARGNVVPCFPEGGPKAFSVNGVPVPEKTVERFASFYRDMGIQNPDQAKVKAIDDAIIMTAAVYADFRDSGRLEEWSSRVRAAEARLKAGEDFASVAKMTSDCPSKAKGGEFGDAFRREQNLVPVSEAAFRLAKDEVSPPTVSVYGAHFVKVTARVDGSSPEKDQRKASHVLIAFDAERLQDTAAYGQKCQRLKKEAHVDSVKEPYKKLIPPSHRK